MTDYTPSGDPLIGSRGLSNLIRDEFNNIATAVNSKENIGAISTVSITPTAIPGSVPNNITQVWETGKSFLPGYYVMITDTSAPATNNMFGMVTSYNATNGVAVVNVTAKNGSGTISSWTIVTTSQSGVTLGTNMFVGAQNFARATVVSAATTADIWNVLGNQIDFTGTATVTGFPDAPQAGASRELICAAACSFTAGANMLIDGIDSGSTVTCAANDVVTVRAISATQFILTRQRYDGRPQKEVGNDVVTVHTGNGHGSINTKIRRYTTILENTGTAITYADSATLGASFTINEAGLYEVTMAERGTSAGAAGASLSSTELTTGIDSISIAKRIFIRSTYDANAIPITRTIRCVAGDVIRPHTDAAVGIGTTSLSTFSVRKIAHV